MKQYRKPFFTQLNENLKHQNIELKVCYGTPWAEEAKRNDNIDLKPPLGVKIKSTFLFKKILIIPTIRPWIKADLIIIEHANKNLLNYFFHLLHFFRIKNIAYWGHGLNRQANNNSFGEKFKKINLHWAGHWFAYTPSTKNYLENQGVSGKKITTVFNSIDTKQLINDIESITYQEIEEKLETLSWSTDSNISIFCGSLHNDKRLDILMEASDLIHSKVSSFKLIIVGNGPLSEEIRRYANQRSWVFFAGSTFGVKKALYLKMSKIWLNPGLVGLGIIDAFCAGLPLVTTNLPIHSPEIDYLVHNKNGLIVSYCPKKYAQAVIDLLANNDRLDQMAMCSFQSAKTYSIENMALNFTGGVLECLKK
jgi:glycosyltransferase involved in cell wall biosynthesis